MENAYLSEQLDFFGPKYNTIQYKNEYYYSGINPVEFRGHSIIIMTIIITIIIIIIIIIMFIAIIIITMVLIKIENLENRNTILTK